MDAGAGESVPPDGESVSDMGRLDEDLLALELQKIQQADFDLDLTGFDAREIDALLAIPDEEKANEAPPLPDVAYCTTVQERS